MIRVLLTLLLALTASPLAAQQPGAMRSGLAWSGKTQPSISAPGVNGVARSKETAEVVTIGPVNVAGAMSTVEADQGVDVSNSRIVGLNSSDLERDGIRLRRATDVEISGFDLAMRPEPQRGDQVPAGIAISAGERISIHDGTVSGFRMEVAEGRHTDGDGIATEGEASGRIRNVVSRNNSDGGFDLKGVWEIDAVTAEGNGKGLGIWEQVTAGTFTSIDNGAALHLAKGASLTMKRLVARSTKVAHVIVLEGAANLTIEGCDLTGMAKGSTLVRRTDPGNVISLGEGCKLP